MHCTYFQLCHFSYFKFPQPFYKKRHTSDSEKGLPPGANAANIKTNLKAVINELKKKGSGISLFSGSASIQTAPEALETSSKKAELTTSFSVKSYNPSIASSWLSDPSTEGVGPNVGLGGADEIDSGKTTSHVSLGKDCVVIALYTACLLTYDKIISHKA